MQILPSLAVAVALSLAAPAVLHAQVADPLKSPACAQALAGLQAARDAKRGVEPARSQAAQACLGGDTAGQRGARVIQPPVAVPPTAVSPPPVMALPSAPSLPPPAVAIPRAPSPAQCDPSGCWTDDGGGRLRRATPGPSGPCMPQGALTVCP
jgi:hypothetical protein